MSHPELTRRALAAYKARGGSLGGWRDQSPGLTPEDRRKGARAAGEAVRAQAVDAYAALAPRLRAWREEGSSYQRIADRLNEEGVTTRRGASWNPVQVKRVLDRIC